MRASSPSSRSCSTTRRRSRKARRSPILPSSCSGSIACWCASPAQRRRRRRPMATRPPQAQRLALAGPAGALQALLETPRPEGEPAPHAFGVVCHPHPLHGGALDNKVVWTVSRAFQQLGAPTLRFNFRGVGASEGTYDEGRGETNDALAVIAYGRQRFPGAALWLGGFSFGGVVAVRAAEQAQPARLVLVAP